MYLYKARIAGVDLDYAFCFPQSAAYLRTILTGVSDADPAACIRVREHEFDAWAKNGNRSDAFAEFCLTCMPTSEALFSFNRCIFHAAAVRWHDRAWLIAAGSGVGKSTQCSTLMELRPDEVSVINGDKPVLECRDDGIVMVHPSPWNGKEGWSGAGSAPLAGIFLLRRGEENSIVPASLTSASCGIFKGIFQSFENDTMIQHAASIAEKIMKSAPSWQLTSCEVPDSTKLMLEKMHEEAEKNGI